MLSAPSAYRLHSEHPLGSGRWPVHVWESSNERLSTFPVPCALPSTVCVSTHFSLPAAPSYTHSFQLGTLKLGEMKHPRWSDAVGGGQRQAHVCDSGSFFLLLCSELTKSPLCTEVDEG